MSPRIPRSVLAVSIALCLREPALAQDSTAAPLVKYSVAPDRADPAIHHFTAANYVVFEKGVKPSAPLLVFMPGTNGEPIRTSLFADAAARQGYRVIGLSYDDAPAVAQICPREPDPRCSERFREKRIYGTGNFSLV